MKTIKIFGVCWHLAHNYSLWTIESDKYKFEWYLLENNIRKYNPDVRALPDNVKFVSYYEPNKYDMAVLHIDQQCIDPKIGKGKLYRELNGVIKDIPKIVINHGTPIWPERWEQAGSKSWKYPLKLDTTNDKEMFDYQTKFLIEGGRVIEQGEYQQIEGMRKLIGTNKMVVNSYRAAQQWGWGKPIWHGLKASDWWDNTKELRSITTLSPAGLDYYYNRDFLEATQKHLKEIYGLNHVHVGNPNGWVIDRHPEVGSLGGWGAYRDYISRSLVYFNPTRESPMPRSRTEAMLSGVCVLTTAYQDEDKFINFDSRPIWANCDGVFDYIETIDQYLFEKINGIIVPDNPLAVAALINHLINKRYKQAVKIGKNGKKTAEMLFNKQRYDSEWVKLIEETIKEKNEITK